MRKRRLLRPSVFLCGYLPLSRFRVGPRFATARGAMLSLLLLGVSTVKRFRAGPRHRGAGRGRAPAGRGREPPGGGSLVLGERYVLHHGG
jgi:hypothetical protein